MMEQATVDDPDQDDRERERGPAEDEVFENAFKNANILVQDNKQSTSANASQVSNQEPQS